MPAAQRVGPGQLHPFHNSRHSAVTNVYRAKRDLFLDQRLAQHVSPLITVVCTHPPDVESRQRLRSLSC